MNVSQYASARVSVQGILKANSVVVEANAHDIFERTHEPCVPTCLLLANHLHNKTNPKGQSSRFKVQGLPILKVKVQYSKVKVRVPTCTRATCHVRRIDYQRLTPCVPITAILHGNLTHFTAQYGPYYRAMWLILQCHFNAMILRLMTAREINR